MKKTAIQRIRLFCCRWLWLCGFYMAGTITTTAARQQSWTNNDAMLAYFEVLQLIESESIAQTPLTDNVLHSIHETLARIDPYCTYLAPTDYKSFLEGQQINYFGIGADLTLEPDGRILLHPHRQSPASTAGIQEGDQLIAVGHESISGLSLTAITAKLRGEPGTRVRVFFEKPDGSVKTSMIARAAARSTSVESDQWEGYETIAITDFTSNTFSGLIDQLHPTDPESPLILDLRGNTGGDLFAAIECAKLFLPDNTFIVRLVKTKSSKAYVTDTSGQFSMNKLFLLQDAQTASAAEVFIDALIQQHRASNWGVKSFGKAVSQHIFPMSNGGALFLTDSLLQRENGTTWNETGIPPEGDLRALLKYLQTPPSSPSKPILPPQTD